VQVQQHFDEFDVILLLEPSGKLFKSLRRDLAPPVVGREEFLQFSFQLSELCIEFLQL